jgi:dipeptide/tripeptide permease
MAAGMSLLANSIGDGSASYENIRENLLEVVNTYVIPSICTVGMVVLMVFMLINAIRYGKAEDGEPKTKAKKQLIGTGIGIVVLFAAIWLLPLLFTFLSTLFPAGSIS